MQLQTRHDLVKLDLRFAADGSVHKSLIGDQ
jgi:hypothetical protein